MKKKIVIALIAGMLAVSVAACGDSSQPSSTTDTSVQESDPVSDSASDESASDTSDETETGEVVEENGMRKEPVYTNTELGISGQTGPFTYSVTGIQVSKLTATTDEAADLLGIEKDKEVALVVIDASAENTTDDTNYFYIGQATLTSNTKEQVEADMFLSDYIDGEFLGNVINSGSLIYILPNSSATDITNVTLHISAPSNSDYENIGDEVTIDIPME